MPDKFKLRQAFPPPQEGKTFLHLQWPSEFRLSLKRMEGAQDSQSRTLLLSFTNPTEDQVASLRLVWPPKFGGHITSSESVAMDLREGTRYPTNQALAWCDSKEAEELLALGKETSSGSKKQVLFRLDRAPSRLQHWRIYQAISDVYKLQQAPEELLAPHWT
eukprot:1511470-Pyramimonas_sp.AAC.1